MPYKIGDEVILKINRDSDTIKNYELVKVQIIGIDHSINYFLCYVPWRVNVNPSFKLTREHQKFFHFPNKFLNETGMFIHEKTPIHKHVPAEPGEICDVCNSFIYMAERTSGTYMCRSCLENPYRFKK